MDPSVMVVHYFVVAGIGKFGDLLATHFRHFLVGATGAALKEFPWQLAGVEAQFGYRLCPGQ